MNPCSPKLQGYLTVEASWIFPSEKAPPLQVSVMQFCVRFQPGYLGVHVLVSRARVPWKCTVAETPTTATTAAQQHSTAAPKSNSSNDNDNFNNRDSDSINYSSTLPPTTISTPNMITRCCQMRERQEACCYQLQEYYINCDAALWEYDEEPRSSHDRMKRATSTQQHRSRKGQPWSSASSARRCSTQARSRKSAISTRITL